MQTIDTRIVLVWLTALLVFVPVRLPAQDVFGEPARAETENPDNMVVGSQNPGDMLAGTETPGSLSGQTVPLPNATPTLSPSELVAPTQALGPLQTQTTSLSSLPEARQADAAAEREVQEQVQAEQPVLAPPTSAGEAQARLDDANSNLERANTAVGKMMQRNYPRGEARAQIYAEQQAAQRAVENASAAAARFGVGGSDAASSGSQAPW